MEDLIGEGFQIGNGDPAEPYIALLRGVDPADHDHQVKMAASSAFDRGWIESEKHYASLLNDRVRDAIRQTERRIHADYSRERAQRRFQNIAVATIALVACVALLYLSRS